MNNRIALHGLISICLAAGVGCGNSKPSIADYNNSNISKLRGMYGAYIVAHDLQGPASEDEFKNYLTTNYGAKVKLERMEVSQDEALDLFVSERDGKPFKIRYGVKGLGNEPIIFETEGVGGMRFVAFVPPKEVDKEEYENLWNSAIDEEDDEDAELTPTQEGMSTTPDGVFGRTN